MSGLTKRSRALLYRKYYAPRPPVDMTVKRYFIYRIHDAEGRILYIGRSCDVPGRLRAHYGDACGKGDGAHKKAWFFNSRRISMVGPFTWDDACRVERQEIETHQPEGNRMFTKAHGYRPLSEGGGQYLHRQPPAEVESA